MAKTKRLVRIQAGRLGRIIVYTQAVAADDPKTRAEKTRMSSPARMRINARTSTQKLEELMATNFGRRDLFVTLTYREAPATREAANRYLGTFFRLLRAARAARGERLLYIKNTEHLRSDGSEGRWHHHVVINATGNDYEEIRSLWAAWGDNVDFEGLLSNGEDYASRAKYMNKERPPLGKQAWTPSRGLHRPTKTSELVDEALTITPDSLPKGAVILEHSEDQNEWGSFVYYKYLLPDREPRPDLHRIRGAGGK